MTLKEAAKKFGDSQTFYAQTLSEDIADGFIAGATWFQQNHSCCCAGCEKHNVQIVTEKQNSEFDET